jgi:hypothetical protein
LIFIYLLILLITLSIVDKGLFEAMLNCTFCFTTSALVLIGSTAGCDNSAKTSFGNSEDNSSFT